MFAEITGYIAVIAITLYGLYILLYRPKAVIVNTCGNHLFQKDDVINIAGTTMNGQYRVVRVHGEQLHIKPRNWFG